MLCREDIGSGPTHMLFKFTLNMASRNGSAVHQVVGEHPAKSLGELLGALRDTGFIVIEERYKDNTAQGFHSEGEIALSARVIGKIKAEK